jgi:hypothetical protein
MKEIAIVIHLFERDRRCGKSHPEIEGDFFRAVSDQREEMGDPTVHNYPCAPLPTG